MTVIAYRDGVMVADTQMQIDAIKSRCVKIAKKNGYLIGLSGSECPPLATFLAAFGKKEASSLKDFKFAGLLVSPRGEIQLWDNTMSFEPLLVPFYAIGSGGHVAIGAMEMGAGARRAAMAAIKWCAGCGAPVTVLRLGKGVRGTVE
jgi:hypothetical protein